MNSIERVASGAEWLDEVAPGWERKVDLSVLDIEDGERCVCGQVFMADALEHASASGFNYAYDHLTARLIDAGSFLFERGCVLAADGDAWTALIKERFDTGLLSDGLA